MAISIDWGSRIITVPQSDLTLISGTLYELDTNWFRLALKDLEDSAEGLTIPSAESSRSVRARRNQGGSSS